MRWPSYLYGTRRYVMRRFPFSRVYYFMVAEAESMYWHSCTNAGGRDTSVEGDPGANAERRAVLLAVGGFVRIDNLQRENAT